MFSTRIRELREKAQLSQKALSEIIQVTQSTYALYELGKREPNLDVLCKLSDYFSVSCDYLLGRTSNEHTTINTHIEVLSLFSDILSDRDNIVSKRDDLLKSLESIRSLFERDYQREPHRKCFSYYSGIIDTLDRTDKKIEDLVTGMKKDYPDIVSKDSHLLLDADGSKIQALFSDWLRKQLQQAASNTSFIINDMFLDLLGQAHLTNETFDGLQSSSRGDTDGEHN